MTDNDETLQFISGMKLKEDKTLVVTTSRLQNYIVGRMDNQDVKYRMIVIDDVHQLLKGSPCKDHA
ncbi:Major royal jelly protein [Sarracenia purpurea var. burkii]